MKKTGEIFRIRDDGTKEVTITAASKANYFESYGTHRIDFDVPFGQSFMLVHNFWGGLSVQVQGQGYLFSHSEGMCGSWNFGGVRFRNGTSFNLSGGYYDIKSRSFDLASSWKIPLSISRLWDPSEICDASSDCGQGNVFQCSDTRQLRAKNTRHLQDPNCKKTCSDITLPQAREQCELDVELTGDDSWACTPNYVNPIIGESVEITTTSTTSTSTSTSTATATMVNTSQGTTTTSTTTSATAQGTTTTKAMSTATTTTKVSALYYADWLGSDTCVNDGNEPLYMKMNPTLWMYATLDECCKKHYGYKLMNCKGSGNVHSGLYYPNWKNNPIEQCINDGNEPDYMSNNPTAWMHDTIESCELMLFSYIYHYIFFVRF